MDESREDHAFREARDKPASVVISTRTLSRGLVSETKSVARNANRVVVDAHDRLDGTGEEDAVACGRFHARAPRGAGM